jgi:hypothetical protein
VEEEDPQEGDGRKGEGEISNLMIHMFTVFPKNLTKLKNV